MPVILAQILPQHRSRLREAAFVRRLEGAAQRALGNLCPRLVFC
jgi:hypothetical protein